jgi:hypothetical protein
MDAGLKDNHTYAVRFWIGMAMKYCLGAHPEFDWMLRQVISVQSEEYYINMMIAWYLATAMATQYDAIFALLQAGKLSPWIANKAIQKGCESRRLSPAQKQQLKALKLASR